jgi:hypothetical protein
MAQDSIFDRAGTTGTNAAAIVAGKKAAATACQNMPSGQHMMPDMHAQMGNGPMAPAAEPATAANRRRRG